MSAKVSTRLGCLSNLVQNGDSASSTESAANECSTAIFCDLSEADAAGSVRSADPAKDTDRTAAPCLETNNSGLDPTRSSMRNVCELPWLSTKARATCWIGTSPSNTISTV